MSSSVIICGIRSAHGIDMASVKQMAGRAGRHKRDGKAVVHIIAEQSDIDEFREKIGYVPDVNSCFYTENAVLFNILSEIRRGNVYDRASAERWYSRSLSFRQSKKCDFGYILDRLKNDNAVRDDGNGGFLITENGKLALSYYFGASEVKQWQDRFSVVFNNADEKNTGAVAWALSTGVNTDFRPDHEYSGMFSSELPPEYKVSGQRFNEAALWWGIISGISPKGASERKKRLVDVFGRLLNVLYALNELNGWNKKEYFDMLRQMVYHGVPYNLAWMFEIDGMTKGLALYLDELGIKSKEELIEKFSTVETELSEQQSEAIKNSLFTD